MTGGSTADAVRDPAAAGDGEARLEADASPTAETSEDTGRRERRRRTREERKAARRKKRRKEKRESGFADLPRGDSDPNFKIGFLVAGVQKGGTSTLHAYLEQHPEIGLGGSKELHFFDNEALDWSSPPYGRYHRSFAIRPDARIYGECTPVYFYWDPSLPRIRAYSPDVRFVVVFRSPIDRAFSHWAMAIARDEDTLLFDAAIREGRARVANDEPLGLSRRVHSYVERGFYGAQMRRFLELYPREQLLPLTSEELFKDHRSALAKVTDFLGVSPFPADLEALHVNRKKKRVEYPSVLTRSDAALLAEVYRDDLADFQALTGLDVSGWLDTSRYPD